jgi:hypothetical protein
LALFAGLVEQRTHCPLEAPVGTPPFIHQSLVPLTNSYSNLDHFVNQAVQELPQIQLNRWNIWGLLLCDFITVHSDT